MNVRLVLGARISAARRARNITQADLAETIGVGANQVSRWERGQAMPAARYLRDLADALQIDRDELYVLAVEASAEDNLALQKENERVMELLKELLPHLQAIAARERERANNNG